MKNLNSLLVRLGALSLAAAMTFSAAEAVAVRKDPKAAQAVIEALVAKTLVNDASRVVATPGGATNVPTAKFTAIDTPVVIGKNNGSSTNLELLVFGPARIGGDLVAGALGEPKKDSAGNIAKDAAGNTVFTTPGLKHIVGITTLDPHTEEFRVSFRDKTATSHGAFVSLDFVTTATSYRAGDTNNGKAVVSASVRNLFCHPTLDASQIAGEESDYSADAAYETDNVVVEAANGSTINSFVINEASVSDVSLQCVVSRNVTSKDTSLRFAPQEGVYMSSDTLVADSGFFQANWLQRGVRVMYDPGTLSYQVASSNLIHASVASVNDQNVLPQDIFTLFDDADLATLLTLLNDYFAGNSTKVRDYLMANRHQLSRAFKAVR